MDVVGWNEEQFIKFKNREVVCLTTYFDGIEEQILILQVATTMMELRDTGACCFYEREKKANRGH